MEKAKLIGTELEYEVTGSGDPVLLISTGPLADSFLPLVSEKGLADRYRLIRYRQRRMNASMGERVPVSFAQHAADAAALLAHLGIRRAHVAGHSTGAGIALQLASSQPDVVATLALLEPPLVRAAGAADFFEKAAPALAAYAAGDRERAMAEFLSAACTLDWETCRTHVERHIPGGVARAIGEAHEFFESYLPALNEWQFGLAQAATISQPVLSVVGTQTERWFAQSHRLLHTWFPQLEECQIDGVGHLLHMQRPEPVACCVAAFFGRHAINRAKPKTRESLARATPRVA